MTTVTAGEAEKMRRVPGIVFADGTLGRVPRIANTGIEVWEVVKSYRAFDKDWAKLIATFDWLSPDQLHAALAYSEVFPSEIDERIRLEECAVPEAIYAESPFMRPRNGTAT